MKPIHRKRNITPTGKGSTTSRSDCWLVALSDQYGHRGNIDRTLKLAIRLSPVPLRKNTETGPSGESAPFCPRMFLLSAYRPEGWLVGAVGIELRAQLKARNLLIALIEINARNL